MRPTAPVAISRSAALARVLALSALGALASCGGSPPSKPTLSSRPDGPVAPRATPAPSIGWRGSDGGYGAFLVTGLPAVARAGEVAVVAIVDGDGGRGYPNLRVEVRDRQDKVIQTIPVMVSSDYDTLAPAGIAGAELNRRIAAASADLARLHGVHDLVPMHALEVQDAGDADKHLAIGDGLDVDWSGPAGHQLKLFHHNGDRPIVVADGASWLVPGHEPCAGCGMCENPALLGGVYHATGIDLVVVDIRYHGTDSCWEPGDQQHVVAW